MEDAADTPRVCEACGEGSDTQPGCSWCTNGFQDVGQQARWHTFRQRMSKISGTYSIFQGLVEGTIEQLSQMPDDEAHAMAVEGRELLCKWLISDPGTDPRNEAGKNLALFHRRFLEFVTKR